MPKVVRQIQPIHYKHLVPMYACFWRGEPKPRLYNTIPEDWETLLVHADSGAQVRAQQGNRKDDGVNHKLLLLDGGKMEDERG